MTKEFIELNLTNLPFLMYQKRIKPQQIVRIFMKNIIKFLLFDPTISRVLYILHNLLNLKYFSWTVLIGFWNKLLFIKCQ